MHCLKGVVRRCRVGPACHGARSGRPVARVAVIASIYIRVVAAGVGGAAVGDQEADIERIRECARSLKRIMVGLFDAVADSLTWTE